MKTRDAYRIFYGSGGPSSKRKNNPPSTEVTSTIAVKDGGEDAAKSISVTHNIDDTNSDTKVIDTKITKPKKAR